MDFKDAELGLAKLVGALHLRDQIRANKDSVLNRRLPADECLATSEYGIAVTEREGRGNFRVLAYSDEHMIVEVVSSESILRDLLLLSDSAGMEVH